MCQPFYLGSPISSGTLHPCEQALNQSGSTRRQEHMNHNSCKRAQEYVHMLEKMFARGDACHVSLCACFLRKMGLVLVQLLVFAFRLNLPVMCHQTKGFISKNMAVHVIIPFTFLRRPLQNSNVKWLNSAFSGEREPQQLIFPISIWKWTHS